MVISFFGIGNARTLNATCVLISSDRQTPTGVIRIIHDPTSSCKFSLNGSVTGLSEGNHGFHIHNYGDLSQGCFSAGDHYNPLSLDHGALNDENKHLGDLGNIRADNRGVAIVQICDTQLSLSGEFSVLGRTIVVHKDPDDLGRGAESSKTTGNSGARLACCIIGTGTLRSSSSRTSTMSYLFFVYFFLGINQIRMYLC
ncbi:unnamed protein product [Protopolystoma xenopodis]|uniref:Superoxide dismutase [Cu-Zn] n=1 Tax=Protopolystoma xenopodis TaxID=117903 RepID=A0A3S5A7E3_9PLAT|nr:unnamed protein product [Protopolystoma xenopodis]